MNFDVFPNDRLDLNLEIFTPLTSLTISGVAFNRIQPWHVLLLGV